MLLLAVPIGGSGEHGRTPRRRYRSVAWEGVTNFMNFWIVEAVNGISFGMLLFLVAAGLSLVYGLMRIINLAQGVFTLLGAYVSLTTYQATNSFFLAGLAGIATVVVIALVMERFFLRRFQADHVSQVLLTLAFVFVFADLAVVIWGGMPMRVPKPPLFEASFAVGGVIYPSYQLFVIGVGVLVAIGLWLFQEKTKVGALIRASVDDAEMARALGINVPLIFMGAFALGAATSALGGLIAGPLIGVYPGLEWEVVLLAMAVIIIGGMGSLKGVVIGSLMVGLVDDFGKVLFPQFAMFLIFGCVAIVLAFKPMGLFGK